MASCREGRGLERPVVTSHVSGNAVSPPSDRLLLALILLAALSLRAAVMAAIPHDFGPGDPSIYRAMARGIAEHGAPRIGFVWHWLSRPASVSHAEDYYEPAFAALLAPVTLLGGGPRAVALVPLLFSMLGVGLAWRLACRFGRRAALAAATIAALDPWSVYYSGVVMKESLVAVLVVALVLALEAALAPRRAVAAAGLSAGLVAAGVGLFQYQLLPVALVTMAVTLARHRREALPWALLAAGAVVGGAVAWAWWGLGVPLSAKLGFFLGHQLWTPEAAATAAADPGRFLPVRYVIRSVFEHGQAALLLLAGVGLTGSAVSSGLRTSAFTLFIAWLWVHGVPLDLWERDFVPLRPLAAALAAGGLARIARMRAPDAAGLATAACVLAIAPWFGGGLPRRLHLDWTYSPTWPAIAISAVILLAAVPAARALARAGSPGLARALPAIAFLAILTGAQIGMPLPRVYSNPQFPGYERGLAGRVRVAGWLRSQQIAGPVLAAEPWDFAEHAGIEVVSLPVPSTSRSLALAREAYAPRWLLLDPRQTALGVGALTPTREVGRFEGWTLYAMTEAGR